MILRRDSTIWVSSLFRLIIFLLSIQSILLSFLSAADSPTATFKTLDFFEAHSIASQSKPKAILILAADIAKPGLPVNQVEWTGFAGANEFALLSIGFKVSRGVRDRDAIGRELAALIEKSAIQKFGGSLRWIGYGKGGGAELLLRAVKADPEKWSYWVVNDASRFPILNPLSNKGEFSPGMIINSRSETRRESERLFRELRRVNWEKQLVTLVNCPDTQINGAFRNRFFRQFVGAVYSGKKVGKGYWLSNYGDEGPPAKGKTPWVNHSWLPTIEVGGAWQLLNREEDPPPRPTNEQISFDAKVGEQKLIVRTPGVLAENPNLKARSVLIWFSRQKSDAAMQSLINNQNDPVVRYAELNRIPIIGWNSTAVWDQGFLQVSSDARPEAVNTADAKFLPIGDALMQTVRRLGRERGWPDQGWLFSADTSAARYGLMMAQAYPFSAVQLHSPSGFENLVKDPSSPWLITCGWADGSAPGILKFYTRARREFQPVVFKRHPDMGHRALWPQRKLSAVFFEEVLDLRDRRGEKFRWSGDWDRPPLPEEFQPKLVKDAEGNEKMVTPELPEALNRFDFAPSRPRPETLGQWYSELLRRAFLLGDWKQGRLIHPSDEATVLPGWRVRLPSWAVAEAWATDSGSFPDLDKRAKEILSGYQQRLKELQNGVEPDVENESPRNSDDQPNSE